MNITRIHKFLAHHILSLKCSLKLRNQINCVIQHYVSSGCDMRYNGEFFILEFLLKHCKSFVDVGANRGEWSDKVLNSSSNVRSLHLFEPQLKLYKDLCSKFSSENINVSRTPLSNEVSEVNFTDEGRSSRISANFNKRNRVIHTDRLDNIVKEPIDFIKVDCEGHDFKVILGSEEIIGNKLNKFISFEYNDLWLEQSSSLIKCIEFFRDFNYKIYRINQNNIVDFDYYLLGDYYRYSNFIAVRNTYTHYLKDITSPIRY
jgi:FkbM family methyltransferase